MKCPPLSETNTKKRLSWATKYSKAQFQTVLWTDEARAMLDGPDGWSKGCFQEGANPRLRFKRQQGGGGIMIQAGIISNQAVGPFLVHDGLKMN